MREADVLGCSEFGKAAARREPRPTGMEFLPSTFVQGPSAVSTRKLENPLAVQGAARAMGQSYVRLMRAATSRKLRDRLSDDEAQTLMAQLLFGSKLSQRPL